ncbi:helix-turn-helix transcriptional regulator [Actinoplanes sp. TRM 88003]|uniref:Helix-turn-helix transcriptional regulator n=1 Tax=Paractinoplanes aksuensis TaxID=2939490 RepID=A0ABT1E1B3_9ACTN|nr:helix-turn-helix transcriptional regulator [Actinoplanes aksuensis]MCO8276878.1 helix-turn-helix transcriptional regulator [Actinoplanes aksuensis]
MTESSHRWDTATLVLRLAPGAVVHHHAHDEHQLVYASTGVISVSTTAGSWIAAANRAIWVPADAPHQHRVHGPTTLHGVGLPRSSNPLGIDVPAVVEVSPLLRELIIHYTEQTAGAGQSRRRRLLSVLIDQLSVSDQRPVRLPAPRDPRLAEACRVVEENLSATLDLEDLAKACRSSKRTLARLFRDDTHMSYVQWRTQLRLYHALLMLAEGVPVGTVARRCGWSTASAFVEVFRRVYGHTPRQRRSADPGQRPES